MYLVRAYGLLGLSGDSSVTMKSGNDIVNGGGRAENHAGTPQALEGLEELERLGDVLGVILKGMRDRLGDDDQGGAVNGSGDLGMLAEDALEGSRVGDVVVVEDAPAGELFTARDE